MSDHMYFITRKQAKELGAEQEYLDQYKDNVAFYITENLFWGTGNYYDDPTLGGIYLHPSEYCDMVPISLGSAMGVIDAVYEMGLNIEDVFTLRRLKMKTLDALNKTTLRYVISKDISNQDLENQLKQLKSNILTNVSEIIGSKGIAIKLHTEKTNESPNCIVAEIIWQDTNTKYESIVFYGITKECGFDVINFAVETIPMED